MLKSNWKTCGFFIFLIVTGCFEDISIDQTPPHIEVDNPANGSKTSAGTFILFNALFSDDQALGTFSIDIHNAFDGHGHGRLLDDPDLMKFSFRKNYELPPVTAHLIALPEEIMVPAETLAGPYHFIVQAIDAEGNATSYQDGSIVEREILIVNGSMAEVEITNMVNGELQIAAGNPFQVVGTITDPPHPALHGFEEVFIALGKPEDLHSHDHVKKEANLYESILVDSELDPYYNPDGSLNISAMVDFTLSQEDLSSLLSEGVEHLELKVEVHDLQGNISIELLGVQILVY